MKAKNVIIGLFVVLALVFGLVLAGCGDDNTGNTGSIPGTPVGVSASASLYFSDIGVSWNHVSGADGYTIYRSLSADGTYTSVGSTSASSFNDTAVSANTTYYYRVSAYNSYGESELSNTA